VTQSEIKLLIEQFLARSGSDLYISTGAKPTMRIGGGFTALDETPLTQEAVQSAIDALLSENDRATFTRDLELNTAIDWGKEARLRINCFMQQQKPGLVIRRISNRVPELEQLKLPPIYGQLALEKRGLIIIAGPAHSGKSTTFAALIGERNKNGHGHIVTIEDPIELIHASRNCIVTQREVGIDTRSLASGLANAVRQSPDMIAIGELRDSAAAIEAVNLAEMGHLVLTTFTAGSVVQAVEQLLLFFPEEAQGAARARLAQALRAVLVQKLVPGPRGKLVPISEVLINEGLSRAMIREGNIRGLRESMEKGGAEGQQSFDQSLAALVARGDITEEVALSEAENASALRMRLRTPGGQQAPALKPSAF